MLALAVAVPLLGMLSSLFGVGTAVAQNTDAPTISTAPAGAFDVTRYGARAGDGGDDTAAFNAAIAAAGRVGTASSYGVVWVPRSTAGAYRLNGVRMRSNVDVQVEGGTVLAPFVGSTPATGSITMIAFSDWSCPTCFVRHAALEGVSVSGGPANFIADVRHAQPVTRIYPVWLSNVDGFVVRNMHGIQVDSNPLGTPPTTYAPVVQLMQGPASTVGHYYDPRNGVVSHVSSDHSPYGFGTIQVESGMNVAFHHISSVGGVALRFETDPLQHPGEIRGMTGSAISCADGHAAVSLTAHDQYNTGVHVSGVVANSCAAGVEMSSSGGAFASSSVDDVSVDGGAFAQIVVNRLTSNYANWVIGRSQWCVDRITASMTVPVTDLRCTGTVHGGA